MNKRIIKFQRMSGQSLVIVAVISTILIGLVAIGIDAGMLYAMRRAAQGAADAGALAGARELCVYDDEITAANNAYARAIEYSQTKNQVRNNTWVSSPTVRLSAGEVDVTVSTTFDTFIAGFFGNPTLTASAAATAGCFAPGSGKGIIPISWRCFELNPEGVLEPDCEINFIEQGTECTPGDDFMYIFIDSDSNKGIVYECFGVENEDADIFVDCDYNDDGVIDSRPIDNANPDKPWFWVDLEDAESVSGAGPLKSWITNGYPKSIPIHTWLYGIPGKKTTLYTGEIDPLSGREVTIPVFDEVCPGPDEPGPSNAGCVWHPEDDVYSKNQSAHYYFHLATFAILNVYCADNTWPKDGNSKGCPKASIRNEMLKPDGTPAGAQAIDVNDSSLEGCFVEGFIPGLGGNPTGGTNAGAYTLYLTR